MYEVHECDLYCLHVTYNDDIFSREIRSYEKFILQTSETTTNCNLKRMHEYIYDRLVFETGKNTTALSTIIIRIYYVFV